MWSVGTTASSGNSVQNSSATATTLTGLDEIGVINGTSGGSMYSVSVRWSAPVCVTSDPDDKDGICQTGDQRVYPNSATNYGSTPVVMAATLSAVMDLRVWQAGLLAAVGWALRAGLDRMLSRPLAGVRTWLWRASTGRPTPIRQQDALAALTSDSRSWTG